MILLGVECSAKPASVAISEDGKLLCEFYSNIGLTHSQTLLPMTDAILKATNLTLSDIDAFAISAGPGSFTGLRIGISAIKGMAIAEDKPCIGVSTLFSMSHSLINFEGIIATAMDARCNQFYCALFLSDGENITRLTEDMALSFDDYKALLEKEIKKQNCKALIMGDGAELFMKLSQGEIEGLRLADEVCRFQSAKAVCKAAEKEFKEGKAQKSAELLPIYLRLPQAERELKKKTEGNK